LLFKKYLIIFQIYEQFKIFFNILWHDTRWNNGFLNFMTQTLFSDIKRRRRLNWTIYYISHGVHLIGKYTDEVANTWIYDVTLNTWDALPNLPLAVSKSTMISYNGAVYLFGGLADNVKQKQVYYISLDMMDTEWTWFGDMTEASNYPTVQLYNIN
jgi:hypothetical protein